MRRERCLVVYIAVCIAIVAAFWLGLLAAKADEHPHHHPTETVTGATARFYESWKRPDMPTHSCCNLQDCYATPARSRGGKLQALHRESGDWIDVPPEKVETDRDSPDGRNHLCASPGKLVFCFVMGGGG
jgi:hypothetical protein